MTDVVYRGGEALRRAEEAQETGRLSNREDAARVVLLAALDPEDDALVRSYATRLSVAMDRENKRLAGAYVSQDDGMRALARIALAELQAMAQGGPRT